MSCLFTVPSEGVTKPAIILNNVDLPQPEGPTIVTNSPFSILKSISDKA